MLLPLRFASSWMGDGTEVSDSESLRGVARMRGLVKGFRVLSFATLTKDNVGASVLSMVEWKAF